MSKEIIISENFLEIPVGIPPMLFAMAGCASSARFVSFNYLGTKATWSDGRASATFSYYAVYQPYVDHPAIRFYTMRAGEEALGSDDNYPTHSIVFDTVNDKTYLAECEAANRLLSEQHPPLERAELSAEEWKRIEDDLSSFFNDPGNMQFHGMFEFIAPPTHRGQETFALIDWLNKHTPDEVRAALSRFQRKALK